MSRFRTWVRQQGWGRIFYRFVHQPWGLARTYGCRLVISSVRGEAAMRRAARRLPPVKGTTSSRPIHFLTGSRFIHQTVFCAHSFAIHANVRGPFEFLSDGSLQPEHAALLRRLFPDCTVRTGKEQDALVSSALPPGKFPALHAVRKNFVLLRKLTDTMAGQTGYRLFFDSDMLFWRNPAELLVRIASSKALYMQDTVDDGYTVTRAELHRRLGITPATGVNSGLVGAIPERIDWDLMERACDFLRGAPGDQRLLEQTLWSIVLGAQQAQPLTAADYRVLVDPDHWSAMRRATPFPVVLHYAWQARLPYTAGEWERYLETSRLSH